jgi:hypothetical protein
VNNAHAGNMKELFKIDNHYSITKHKGLHLVHNAKVVFSISDENLMYDGNQIEYNDNFDGHGKKVITVSETVSRFSTMGVYVVNLEENKIKWAGMLPVFGVTLNKDGTFLYDSLDEYGKRKTIYGFSNDDLMRKKSTAIIYEGNVCISDSEGFSSGCEAGIPATVEAPICLMAEEKKPYKIVSLKQCSIFAEIKSDGTLLHEYMNGYGKFKAVFSGNEPVIKKSTALIYEGKVCILDSGNYNVECKNGIPATVKAPVCLVKEEGNPFRIIPFEQCDVRKEEISNAK